MAKYLCLIALMSILGIILMLIGLSTIQAIYFGCLLSSITCWGLILLSEIKRPQVAPTTKGHKNNK